MNDTDYNTIAQVLEEYAAKGWCITSPLPEGKKFPPATGITGAVADYAQRLEAAEEAWGKASESSNLALVMATDSAEFDLLALDIDDYDKKQGAANFAALERRLGSLELETVPRSTRRGSESLAAHYFFRVEKGYHYEKKACDDVDVIQPDHRYAVAYPSTVDGLQYQWYLGDNATDIPAVDTLPELPESWQQHLRKGPARSRAAVADVADYPAAFEWLEERVLPGEAEEYDLPTSNRHDFMHEEVCGLVAGAVFKGRAGLLETLNALLEWYEPATGRTGEFERSVIAGVAYAKGQIETGKELETNWKELQERAGNFADLAMPDFAELLKPEAETKPQTSVHGLMDLTAIVSGDLTQPEPSIGSLTDGSGLLYPGEIHDVHGYSGSGKTWVGLALAVQEVQAGNGVLWLDFEQNPFIVVNRLMQLGLTDQQIVDQFGYMRPEAFPVAGSQAEAEFKAVLAGNKFSLAVIDGVNQSFSLAGFGINDNDDANAWHRLLPERLAKTGAAVVQIDHTVKNREGDVSHAIGAQAKRANPAVSFAAMATKESLRPGHKGKLELVAFKDRHGVLLSRGEPYRGGHLVASFVIEADNTFYFEPLTPRLYSAVAEQQPGLLDGHSRLEATDPRHMATVAELNNAVARVLCARTGNESVTQTDLKKAWQELAPVRWKEDKPQITASKHPGLKADKDRSGRVRFTPLAESDKGASVASIEKVKTLVGYVLDIGH